VQATDAIVINDEIPGPEIRAKLGDTIRVNVMNLLHEPTTMHFHGITQFRTPFMDGDEMVRDFL
jgi:laccase